MMIPGIISERILISQLEKLRGGRNQGPQITGQPVFVETWLFAEASPYRSHDRSVTGIALVDSAAPTRGDGLN